MKAGNELGKLLRS